MCVCVCVCVCNQVLSASKVQGVAGFTLHDYNRIRYSEHCLPLVNFVDNFGCGYLTR